MLVTTDDFIQGAAETSEKAKHSLWWSRKDGWLANFEDMDTLRREAYRILVDGADKKEMRSIPEGMMTVLVLGAVDYESKEIQGYVIRVDSEKGWNGCIYYGDNTSWSIVRRNGRLGKSVKFLGPRLDEWKEFLDDKDPYSERVVKGLKGIQDKADIINQGKIGEEQPVLKDPTKEDVRKYKKIGRNLAKKLSKKYSMDEVNEAVRYVQQAVMDKKVTAELMPSDGKEFYFDWEAAMEYIEAVIKARREGRSEAELDRVIEDLNIKNAKEELEAMAEEMGADDGSPESERPLAGMTDREASDALYDLNGLSHVYFLVVELQASFDSMEEKGTLKGLSEQDVKGIRERLDGVADILANAYDSRTYWLVTGREE